MSERVMWSAVVLLAGVLAAPVVAGTAWAAPGTTPPSAPAAVSSVEYPADGQLHGGAGVAGWFVITPPAGGGSEDLAGYAYTLDNGMSPARATRVAADPTTRTAVVSITPSKDGPNTLWVWSRDTEGYYSVQPLSYSFGVRAGAGPDAVWGFDEGQVTSVADSSGHGNPATLNGGASWTPGFDNVGSALLPVVGETGAGEVGAAVTEGPLRTVDPEGAVATVRTDANLTVSAWARLDVAGGGVKAVVSQDGARTSAFSLEYAGAEDRWRFTFAGSDLDAPTTSSAISDAAPQVGRWTYLTGTFDRSDRTLRLYVDGVAQATTAAVAGGFNATGRVAVGRRRTSGADAGPFTGAIDDVRISARVVGMDEPEFTAPLRPRRPVLSFPDGTTTQVGMPLRVTLDAGGDPRATSMRYSVGALTLGYSVVLPSPGGRVTVEITPTWPGETYVFAAAVGGPDGTDLAWQSEATAAVITVTSRPVDPDPGDDTDPGGGS